MKTAGRRRNNPPELARLVQDLRNARQKHREASAEMRTFRREQRSVMGEHNRLLTKQWRARQRVYDCERIVGLYEDGSHRFPVLAVQEGLDYYP